MEHLMRVYGLTIMKKVWSVLISGPQTIVHMQNKESL